MNSPNYVFFGFSLLSAGIISGCRTGQQNDERNTGRLPNIVIIYTVDLGYGDTGAYAETFEKIRGKEYGSIQQLELK